MFLGKTAADYFGSMVESYDSLIRRAVPQYDDMQLRLLAYLPATASRVLELGCGTGNLSVALAARYPSATLTLVDAAPEMISVTRGRLGREARFIQRRFEELTSDLGRFDLIVSSISLHHVRDKGPVYRVLYEMLDRDGRFRFSDQIRGATEEIHQINWERWLEFCRDPRNCTPEEIQSLLDHAEAHDHYTPLEEQFDLLHAAGFRNLDCVWRNWIWGIVTADGAPAAGRLFRRRPGGRRTSRRGRRRYSTGTRSQYPSFSFQL